MLQGYDGCWFALQVRSNAERTVLASLERRGYEGFLPTYTCARRWSDRVKTLTLPLFTSYLFFRFSSASSLPVITIPGVLRILGIGKTPQPVEKSTIDSLKAMVATNDLRYYPWPKLEVGDEVCMRSGPLRGLVGVLREIKNGRAMVVSIPLLQRSVAVEIQEDWLARVSAAA
jgi:transcription antitermination factor NusG